MNAGFVDVFIEVEEIVEYTSEEDAIETPEGLEEEEAGDESSKYDKVKKSSRSSGNRSGHSSMGKRNRS